MNDTTGALDKVRVVLVETSHPGNIGAAARSMKTMGLKRLYLVRPKTFPSAEATARAAGADDLLYDAVCCDCLDEALTGAKWVVGTSARGRHIDWPTLLPRDCAIAWRDEKAAAELALVFGRENSGLNNEELDRCHAVVTVPTNPKFRSLNLASAVQLLAYELRSIETEVAQSSVEVEADADPLVHADELKGYYAHLERALIHARYLDPQKPKLLMRRLMRLFNRSAMRRSELNILRGILTAVEKLKP